MDSSETGVLFTPGRIGNLEIKNRIVRSATNEGMATEKGEITEHFLELHSRLSKGGVGLQITGNMYVHPRGQHSSHQAGIHNDSIMPGMKRLASMVHSTGGVIFAQLNHAGSQTLSRQIDALAPSAVQNPITGVMPKEAEPGEIAETIESFGEAAKRARDAGFDGVHLHAGHGYLLSEFSSPYSNRREDEWGGDESRRSRFLMEVYGEIRRRVGSDYPIICKMGMEDKVESGLRLDESVRRAARLASEGVDALEVTCGVMGGYESVQRYVGVSSRRALSDLLFHRIGRHGAREAYFLDYAKALKKRLSVPVILLGGLRTTQTMTRVIRDGDADFVSLARPLIREPDLPLQIRNYRRGMVDCTSCNICVEHDGYRELRCWRKSPLLLLRHIYISVRGR